MRSLQFPEDYGAPIHICVTRVMCISGLRQCNKPMIMKGVPTGWDSSLVSYEDVGLIHGQNTLDILSAAFRTSGAQLAH